MRIGVYHGSTAISPSATRVVGKQDKRTPKMKILSFNMCLDSPRLQERIDELGKLVQSTKPEFLAVQDINIELAKKIKKLPWGERYHLVQPNITYEMRTKPCNVIFSTYPPRETKSQPFKDTDENKTMFYASFVMHDKKRQPHEFCIANVRLECKEEATKIRESQLVQTLYMIGENCDDSVVVGDLNVQDIDGTVNLLGGWEDAWLASGKSSESGNTFDPQKNSFVSRGGQPSRPDRAFYRLCLYGIDSIELVGTEPVDEGGLFISERFGLLLNLSVRDVPVRPSPPVEFPCSFKRPYSLVF